MRMASHPLRWALLTELVTSDQRVRELAAAVDEPQNLVSYHLRLLRSAGLIDARRSSFDGRDSYYRLNLTSCARAFGEAAAALHPALAPAPPTKPTARPSGFPTECVVIALSISRSLVNCCRNANTSTEMIVTSSIRVLACLVARPPQRIRKAPP